ncbi:Nif3-like dinuclear metal center hexameric protein [Alloscardovia venturai]|uniref:GTP cyclohydrolase 1 type 2 homolog n=1 Tax=Alloscardovia venturai TaxID=1769421 RepID=A0ABW2Y3N0_9BIFI
MSTLTVGQIVKVLEALYPLRYAEDWDEPGLIVGDTGWQVSKIYCAVDPTEETVSAAISAGAQLLITHHPLYFRATHTVAGSTFRGALVTKLIENHCALWVGHTNADSAVRGQGKAFVEALGLKDCGALVPREDGRSEDKQEVERVGLGRIGEYDQAISLAEFAKRVSDVLPRSQSGILIAGDPHRQVRRVAALPGSGDSEIKKAAACGADVYVTSDLRHHPVLDAVQETGMAFINTPHAAIEKLWFNLAQTDIPEALLTRYGVDIPLEVTRINTDPWSMRI